MAVTSGCVVDVASGAATASSDGANNNSGGTAPSSTGTTPSAATAGGSSSSSVVQPFSRVLLSCEFDTFNHAESFSKPSNVNASSAAGASPYRSQQRSSTSRMSALMGGSSDGEAKDEFSMDDFNDHHQQQQQQHGASSSSHRYRYSLRSEPFIPRSEYAVGVFRDGALHLTTVASVQQFTPVISSSASAVNSARMAAKQQQRSNSGNSNVAAFGGVPNIPEFCSGLLVEEDHCSRKPSDENHTNGGNNGGSGGGLQAIGPIADMIQRQLRRQRSFAINTDATATKVVEYFRSNTVESGVISRRLSASTTSSSSSNTRGDTANHKLYSSNPVLAMKTIFPMERIVDHGATLQREFLLKHSADVSISNQIRDLIQSSQVMSLSSLLRLLVPPTATTPISIDAVLEALRGSAFFMHGVWVAKSNERVFRGNSAAMREVILLKFWQSPDGTVRREELNSLVVNRGSAMVAIIKSILESVSTLLTSSTPENRRWVLKEMSEDAQVREELCRTFSEQHPNEYQFQQAAWTKRVQQILSHIPVLDSGKFVRGLAMAATAAAATSGSNGSSLMASPIRNRNSTGGGGSAGGNGGAVATLSTSSAPLSGDFFFWRVA
ncbi:Hypothetical protein, putative [Bodo saltans]|uniref:Uncharacterized protein n=1 Tax=Bodo saltans TaxID=75058 RepID=A0A0S4JEL9_BODSA|nr:Hypothetical protein, putative [Bodo saltans]|eukprot:CUG87616.1 Hypothetical protein, putative [Bodo saltans]